MPEIRSFEDACAFLDSLVNYERVLPTRADRATLGTERVAALLAKLDDPHKRFPSVHVAGTKGKGSTCAMIEAIARSSGLRTGLFTSPHLVDVRERIRVDGKVIPGDRFAALLERTRPHVEEIRRGIWASDLATPRRATYFEVLTHTAFMYFAECEADLAVVEVGMGGRLDATNVIHPLCSAITRVSFDHIAQLGGSLSAIAAEKAGIIKDGVPVVVAPQSEEALAAVERIAKEKEAPVLAVGREIILETGEELFSVRTPAESYTRLHVALAGDHQVENAAVAVGVIDVLRSAGFSGIEVEHVRDGLRSVCWPGRFEVIGDSPPVVLDGAHNRDSIRALVRTVQKHFPGRKVVVVFAGNRDKYPPGMLDELAAVAGEFLLTGSSAPKRRSAHPDELLFALVSSGHAAPYQVEPDPVRAVERAKKRAGKEGLVLVTGSLYLVGAVRPALVERE